GAPTVDDDFAPAQPGEVRAHLAARVGRALSRLDESCRGCTVVVAAHADVIAAIIGTVVEAPPEAWDVFRIAPGTVSVVRRWRGRGEGHAMGCPAQLGRERPDELHAPGVRVGRSRTARCQVVRMSRTVGRGASSWTRRLL